ncbi:MAG: glycoside hydrolase family 16 protein [Flavobacteriaceae bacterium]
MKFKLILILVLISLLSCNKDELEPTTNPPLVFEYQLIWEDEFNGSDINRDDWTFEIWNAGHVNNEWQKYVESDDNYKVENGKLHITVTKTDPLGGFGNYNSTRLISKNKQEFKYGRIEFKAKMPSGRGTWPALWMLGSNIDEVSWPKCGEIDVLEYVGYQENKIHNNIHTQDDYGATANGEAINLSTAEENFHIYGITWTSSKIEFYLDDPTNITNTYKPSNRTEDNWPFSQDFFIIMNFAVGGIWGGLQGVDETIWPQTMEVDYVKVYQLMQI